MNVVEAEDLFQLLIAADQLYDSSIKNFILVIEDVLGEDVADTPEGHDVSHVLLRGRK